MMRSAREYVIPPADPEAVRLLREFLVQENATGPRDDQDTDNVPLELEPHQLDFVSDRTTYALSIVGGIASGKTHALGAYIMRKASEEWDTGTLGGIFAATYQMLEQATLTKVWEFFDRLGWEYGVDYVYNEQPPAYWRNFESRFHKHTGIISMRQWGQIVCRSLDNPDAIRGIEIGWAAHDEMRETDQEGFKVVLGRIRCPRCRHHEYRGVTSPNGYDWIYKEFVEKQQEHGSMFRLIGPVPTRANRSLNDISIRALEVSYDERFTKQELLGQFIPQIKGAVYYNFDRKIHTLSRPPEHGRFLVSFDFNRSPFCVVIAQEIAGKLYFLGEVKLQDAGTDTACHEVFRVIDKLFNEARKRTPGLNAIESVEVYGDASGSQRSTKSNQSDYDIITQLFATKYKNTFIPSWKRKNPPIQSRLNAVNGMLKPTRGEPRVFVDRGACPNLQQDFEQVVYRFGTADIDKTTNREHTHLTDAAGYLIYDRYYAPKSTGRVMI